MSEGTPSFLPVTVLDAYGGVPDGVEHPFETADGVETPEPVSPIVDLAARTVTIWTGGSYSCPTWPKAIRASGDAIDIVIGIPDGVTTCTADLRVTTYVVELPQGYAPEGDPAVNVLAQGPGPGGAADVVRDVPPDDAGGCRPALTVCAMNRWLDEMLSAAGLEPLGQTYDPLMGSDAVLIGGDHVSASLGPPEHDGRIPIEVSRTTDVGPVVVQHGTLTDGVVLAAVLTCGGFVIRLDGSAWLPPADVFARTAERIAAGITECPADLDQLVARYPDLRR